MEPVPPIHGRRVLGLARKEIVSMVGRGIDRILCPPTLSQRPKLSVSVPSLFLEHCRSQLGIRIPGHSAGTSYVLQEFFLPPIPFFFFPVQLIKRMDGRELRNQSIMGLEHSDLNWSSPWFCLVVYKLHETRLRKRDNGLGKNK